MDEIKKRKTPKRIVFNVSNEVHTAIKIRAAFRHITITKYIMRAIMEKILQEPCQPEEE